MTGDVTSRHPSAAGGAGRLFVSAPVSRSSFLSRPGPSCRRHANPASWRRPPQLALTSAVSLPAAMRYRSSSSCGEYSLVFWCRDSWYVECVALPGFRCQLMALCGFVVGTKGSLRLELGDFSHPLNLVIIGKVVSNSVSCLRVFNRPTAHSVCDCI